jgi:hypothetical protein
MDILKKTFCFVKIPGQQSPSFSMMKQMTFADAEYSGKRKQTRKELFLIEMRGAYLGRGWVDYPNRTPISEGRTRPSCLPVDRVAAASSHAELV